jgi:hypothetical protein
LAQAYARPDADAWEAAMREELASLQSKGVYELVSLPPDHKAIDLRWVFSYKLRPDGCVERYKARLVAKGYTQQWGIDFYEVWAPTGRLAAYRLLLAHAAHHGLPVYLLDFKTAFLNGHLQEEIYVTQPPGFSDVQDNCVWRLRRALYGLKQAAHAWHQVLVEALQALGYRPSQVDPAVYIRSTPDGVIMLHTHVDDCAATGPSTAVRSDFSALLARFEGRELGEIDGQVFLGMYHERDWSTNTIYISQPKHVHTVLTAFGAGAKPVSSPLDHKVVLSTTSVHDKQEHPQLSSYAALVGSLMYIASCTRPDLCFSASLLARFMSNPSDQHMAQALRAVRYLSKTQEYRLAIGRARTSSDALVVWSDSDHAGCLDSRRSVAGHVVSILGSTVHWRSVRQSAVAKSTMIAEYYAASSAADECVYFRQLLSELGYELGPTPLMCDNESACSILEKPVINDRSRYAAVNAHYVRERVSLQEIKIVSARTDEMLADCMTKALTPDKHLAACKMLGVAEGGVA